jgi:hypothetical protein
MSKTFLAGNNTDSTASTIAFLTSAAGQNFREALLILIGEYEDPDALFLTDWESPLLWRPWGKFFPGAITKDKMTSQIGFEVESFNLKWSPPQGSFTNNIQTTSPYQRARLGVYDNRRVRVWRTVMPTPGDADTYGACAHFGGWVSSTKVLRDSIEFDIASYLNALSAKVPPNVIENTNALAGFVSGAPVLADGETSVPTFTVQQDSSALVILGDCIQPTAHKIYSNQKFLNGYLVFMTGSLKGRYSGIGANTNFNAGGGVHYNQFQVYSQFPWDPAPGDTFYVTIQPPVTNQDATGGIYQDYSFPFLPDPEASL